MLPLRFPFCFFLLDFAAKPGNKNVVGYIMCPVGNKYVVVVIYFFLGNFLSVSLCLYWAMMIVARLMMK